MWTFLQIFIEFVTILFLFYVFDSFWLQSMWDLSSPTKDQSGEGGNEFCFHPVVFETSVTVR